MPYLRFSTTDKQSVQLSGNSADDFVKAIEKHGKIAHVDYALAWVRAYFERRSLEVTLQKAARGEVSVDEDEIDRKLDVAEADEAKYKEAYEAVCKGKKTNVTVTSTGAEDTKKSGDDYSDFYNAPTTLNEVSEDMF